MIEQQQVEDNNKKSVTSSQCPYAVALSEDEESSTGHHHEGGGVPSQIAEEISHCPAFSDNNKKLQCPFREAKSPLEVQKTLAQIPKSHYSDPKQAQAFYHVMQHLHQVVKSDHSLVDKLPNVNGQCPMQPYLPTTATATAAEASNNNTQTKTTQNFAQAFEDCSLAAIMGRLAADMEQQDKDKEQQQEGEEDHGSVSSSNNQNNGVGVEELNPVETETSQPISTEQPPQNADAKQEEPKQRDSLAQALKQGTAVSHQAAEDVHFVRNFIRGQIDRELYQSLILSLYHVYVSLEEALDKEAPKHFDTCHFPEALRRVPALREDVEFWHNTTDPSPRTISPATQDYMDRIQYLAQHDPLLLLAHSYTRYLGDLSGGRVLARVARRALDLDKDGLGLAFYEFDKVKSYKEFKDNYRKALDELPLTSHQIQALVAEANVAFCLNMRIFQELDVTATIPGARVMSLEEVMSYAHKSVVDDDKNGDNSEEDKCPFLVNKKQQQQQQQSTGGSSEKTATDGKRCPWPFIFAHDPAQGLKDWQTWVVLSVVAAVWLTKASIAASHGTEQFPWPFVFAHDPAQGLKDWQTWALTSIVIIAMGLAKTSSSEQQRCPWPFVFAHDPVQGLKDWQTWAMVSVVTAAWLQQTKL